MDAWLDVYASVLAAMDELDVRTIYFRGQRDVSYRLQPGLARVIEQGRSTYSTALGLERSLKFHFVTRAGGLLPDIDLESWRVLFAMQHYGLPTRLLDWIRTFAIALYFAIRDATDACAVWLLNPADLNGRTLKTRALIDAFELPQSYDDSFLRNAVSAPGDVVALTPFASSRRILQQHSAFTLHGNLSQPLEELHPDLVRKIVIPKEAFGGAKQFLALAGISEFTLFPDLDGLARDICLDLLRRPGADL